MQRGQGLLGAPSSGSIRSVRTDRGGDVISFEQELGRAGLRGGTGLCSWSHAATDKALGRLAGVVCGMVDGDAASRNF